MPEKVVVSHVFFYLEPKAGRGTLAVSAADGLTVPFFSSAETAKAFQELHSLQGYQITLISPGQMQDFSEACKRAGAITLQLDPLPSTMTSTKFAALAF